MDLNAGNCGNCVMTAVIVAITLALYVYARGRAQYYGLLVAFKGPGKFAESLSLWATAALLSVFALVIEIATIIIVELTR